MKTVPLAELEHHFRRYLRDLTDGEIILVTDRGQVVAELRQPSPEGVLGLRERLVSRGVLVEGLPQGAHAYQPSPLPHAVEADDLLDAERGQLRNPPAVS